MRYMYSNGELYHYGIKGQKWGVRRWQNEDGSLTPDGRKRYLKEYRRDNIDAFNKGLDATILNRAATKAIKKAVRIGKAYKRKPTERRAKKRAIATMTATKLAAMYAAQHVDAVRHEQELIRKYGKEAIRSIRYDKKGRINEWVNVGSQAVASLMSGRSNVDINGSANLTRVLIENAYKNKMK